MRCDPTRARWEAASGSWNKVPNFEAIFRIPASHSLMAVRSKSHDGAVRAVCWEHDEYDARGRLVARYQSFEQLSATGEWHSGWRKFDRAGQLLREGEMLK